jgi:hypothetical protein
MIILIIVGFLKGLFSLLPLGGERIRMGGV